MEEDQVALSARLTLHETLLEMVLCGICLSTPAPQETLDELAAKMRRILAKTWSRNEDADFEAVKLEMIRQGERFMANVSTRLIQ